MRLRDRERDFGRRREEATIGGGGCSEPALPIWFRPKSKKSIKSTEEVDEWRRRRQSPSALDIGTWGFILDSVYEHGDGSVGGNSFIAFARKKGAVEEGFE
nr:hypothetical protein CFP56_05937 [Quercus suber]